jgi:thiamine pyrophosphate-dependent acetolactate synthase large subunit-like protein
VSANLDGMPSGLPYAVAARLAHPGRPCIALVASDGFAKVMGELLTLTGQRLPVRVLLANTSSADFAAWADACGALGLRVEAPERLEEAVLVALGHDGPVLVDVLVDGAERPVPALPAGG